MNPKTLAGIDYGGPAARAVPHSCRLEVPDLGMQRLPAVSREQPSAHFVHYGFRRHWPQQDGHRTGRGFVESLAGQGH